MKKDQSPTSSPTTKGHQNSQPDKQSPKKTKEPEKTVGRKIPQTMIASYDLVTLKEQRKKRFDFKKSESNEEPTKNPDLQKLHPLSGECYCSQDLKEQWTETFYQLTSTLLALSKICSFRIRWIRKIKLIGEIENENTKSKYLKITWKPEDDEEENQIFIRLKSLEDTFFLFASIISRKLLLQDFALLDITQAGYKSFEGGISKIEGEIFKLSMFLRKWEKKRATIDEKLIIYKQNKAHQEIRNLKQVWTRFTMHNGYFVVKMFQGIQKIEVGIPLTDYSNIKSQRNWLFLLSKMIK